jgi:Icc protein
MKFIQLTDTHVIGGDRLLFGANPARRLRLAVDSINREHGDAEFVIVTGDMTHWGDADAYAAFSEQLGRLQMPVHLMVGNHDDTSAFAERFPDAPRDENGFVQKRFEAAGHHFILLDTKMPGTHAGAYCQQRCAWLERQLQETDGPVLLFMHHPPFKVGINAMDTIMLQDADAFHGVIAPYKQRIRHLFYGHVHRAIFGSWRGIFHSCMRGLNHQVALEFGGHETQIKGDLAPPAYGVVLLDDDNVVVHMHDFTDASPNFGMFAPEGEDPVAWQLNMRHSQWHDMV